jgi:hypothetical protein
MSMANGAVLCDEFTYEASKEKIVYQEGFQLLRVKGFDKEIPGYIATNTPVEESNNPSASNSRGSWQSQLFIGRESEKTFFGDIIQSLKTRTDKLGKVIVLEGEGKLLLLLLSE